MAKLHDLSELSEFESVRNWIIGFHKDTRRNYLRFLKLFCQHTGKDPEQLMRIVRRDRTRVHLWAKEFYHRLSARGEALTSRTVGYMTIRSFFNHNDYPLGPAPRRLMRIARIKADRLLAPREVSDMIGSARMIRSRAIISFLAQSGQRPGVLTAIRYGSIRRQIELGISPIVVEITTGMAIWNGFELTANKGATNYRFAIGRECRDYVVQMLNQRKHAGEKIDDDSVLFKSMAQWTRDDKGKWIAHNASIGGEGAPMQSKWVNWVIRNAAYSAGLQAEIVRGCYSNGKRKVQHEITSSRFRVFWKHQMRAGGVNDTDLLDFLMGHRPRYGGAYDRFDAEYVRKEYAKAEPMLTVMSHRPMLPDEAPSKSEDRGKGLHTPQKIVREENLVKHLQLGWNYVATLPSGRIVIGQAN